MESRVFGEADMEQALDAERRRTRELEKELRSLKESPKHSDKNDLYCELCEVHGHDVISCTALIASDSNKKHAVYCENCEQHNTHSTEDCPNQDEVF